MPFVAIAVLLFSIANAQLTSAPKASAKSSSVLPVKACGVLDHPGATYKLANDVRAAGTCFSIQADNITLDLRKHTVAYGMSDKGKPVFGVLAADCWDTSISGNPCGGTHRHLTIMNGNIMQGPAAAPFSHAIQIGQAKALTGVKIYDLDITVAAPDSIAIYTEYLPGGSDVYGNTIHNNVRVISNRYQFRGTSIKLDNESDAKLPDTIHDNTIIGGAQLGIRDDNPAGTRIYANNISQDATYANGFCIDAAGNGMLVYRNYCHPIHGRGIHANHSGVQIFDNVIETTDSNQIQEYNGCELHGTYGIQVESDGFNPTDVRVYGNQVTVHAAKCPASAMRLSDLKGSTVQVYGNTFIAVQDKTGADYSTAPADGLCVGDLEGSHMRFYSNIVRADSSIFTLDWDSGGQITLNNNTFQAGRKGRSTLMADFENGVSPSHENYFLDNKYDGFSSDSSRFGPYVGDTWYVVLASIHLDVTSNNGRPLDNLSGTAVPIGQVLKSEGVVQTPGKMMFSLPVVRVENNKAPIKYQGYEITLSAQGCRTDTIPVSATTNRVFTHQLSCE